MSPRAKLLTRLQTALNAAVSPPTAVGEGGWIASADYRSHDDILAAIQAVLEADGEQALDAMGTPHYEPLVHPRGDQRPRGRHRAVAQRGRGLHDHLCDRATGE